ncbi:MAG TPA: redoxin domain-containing protein [Planctomycetia bacterium]|nr:redoxin domain-containing protein [Planctomycetia bacterium]
MFLPLAALILATPLEGPADAAPAKSLRLGDRLASAEFKDIRYLRRNLQDLGAYQALALVFHTAGCPLAQRTWPSLVEIEKTYRGRGVKFLAVNVGADDDLREIARLAIDFNVPFPFVKDEGAKVAARLGVAHVPTVALLDKSGSLRYRGRVDDRVRLGGEKPNATRADLREAIEDVLAGTAVRVPETLVDGCGIAFPGDSETEPPARVDYATGVGPILKRQCQDCHRKGGAAPFTLASFADASAHAATIAEVVADRRMPPWYGSDSAKFVNHRALSDSERKTVLDWVRGGRQEGDSSKAPAPLPPIENGWTIGAPDRIIEMVGKHDLPATGIVDYKYVVLPAVFTYDTWVEGVEIRADNPAVLHHCNLGCVQIGGDVKRPRFVTGKVPGGQAMTVEPGVAFRIPAGAVLGLQAHYVTTGKPETCKLSVGLRYARTTVKKELRHLQIANTRFTVPPHAPFHEVNAERTLPVDAVGVGMFAHMHLRARDMLFKAELPDGKREELLCIPNYNFDWQQAYVYDPAKPKALPKGTKIRCTVHYDNTAFNPYNPDPNVEVKEGQQTADEMLYGFYFYVAATENLGLSIDPKTGAAKNASEKRP